MAKKKKKKYQQKYTTGGRVDYRKGGRVSLSHGGPHGAKKAIGEPRLSNEEPILVNDDNNRRIPVPTPKREVPIKDDPIFTAQPQPTPQPTPTDTDNSKTSFERVPTQSNPRDEMIFADNLQSVSMDVDDIMDDRGRGRGRGREQNGGITYQNGGGNTGGGNTGGGNTGGGNQQSGGTTQETPLTEKQKKDLFESERSQRIIDTGRTAQDIASGKLPDLPEAEVEKVSQEGTTASTVQMDDTTAAEASTISQPADETVTTIDADKVAQAQVPLTQVGVDAEGQPIMKRMTASQMEAATVDTEAKVDAAQGQVSDQSIAQAAKVARVSPIEGAEVEIPEGALTDRVVGSISEGAKAIAAQNAGTSLSRITRAKKQLSKAGLSDSDIQEIGNDPEALEDRLADFSEQERGIIAGLPEEALVSTQLNGLLEGMENGEIPPWAKPAVTQVEQMLATRGLSASSVGRDNLFNAIIQSALPIAQSNAQAIQQSVSQQRNIEAQEAEANAQRMQQTALTNANNVFQMDMAQFSSDQQIALSNSKFLQTVGLTEASNDQQSTIQNAALMSQANLTEADFNQRSQIQNAQAFLQMDMANLTNQQQSNVLKAQQEQQRILSNQSATNAARQFNSASENQTNQFMASLEANINQFNTAQMNANNQFNAQSKNAAAARDANRVADVNKANAAILNQVSQFNAQLDFNREQWNSANEQAIINSNVNWRRQSNLADTAAQNAVNQQNAQNAFGLTSSALSFLWQELRDQADYDFKWATDTANRKLNAMIAAASSEGDAAKNWSSNFERASSTVSRIFGET